MTRPGPDAQRTCRSFIKRNYPYESNDSTSNYYGKGLLLDFFASELRLRGKAPVVQPHECGGDIFCWNGEVSHSPFS